MQAYVLVCVSLFCLSSNFFFCCCFLKHDVSQAQNLKVAENFGHLLSSSLVSHQILTPSGTTCPHSCTCFCLGVFSSQADRITHFLLPDRVFARRTEENTVKRELVK